MEYYLLVKKFLKVNYTSGCAVRVCLRYSGKYYRHICYTETRDGVEQLPKHLLGILAKKQMKWIMLYIIIKKGIIKNVLIKIYTKLE